MSAGLRTLSQGLVWCGAEETFTELMLVLLIQKTMQYPLYLILVNQVQLHSNFCQSGNRSLPLLPSENDSKEVNTKIFMYSLFLAIFY